MATISKTGISNGSVINANQITNIIDALDGTTATTILMTGPVTASAGLLGNVTGNLIGTSSWATKAITADSALSINFSAIANLPNSINNGNGTSITGSISAAFYQLNPTEVGRFYVVDTSANSVDIEIGSSPLTIGDEATFFQIGNNTVTFTSSSNSITLYSNQGFLSLNGEFAAASIKMIGTDTYALIGNLKA